LSNDLLDAQSRGRGAMTFGSAHTLAALFLEDSDLGTASLAFDDRHDAGVSDERRAGDDLAGVFFKEQHLLEGQLGPRLASRAVDGHEAAGRDLDLTTTRLNDCVHHWHLYKTVSVHSRWFRCKELDGTSVIRIAVNALDRARMPSSLRPQRRSGFARPLPQKSLSEEGRRCCCTKRP